MLSNIATTEFPILLSIIDFNPVIQINDIGLAAWFGCPDCITITTLHHNSPLSGAGRPGC